MSLDEMRIGLSLLHLGNWSGTGFYTEQVIRALCRLTPQGVHGVGLAPPGALPNDQIESLRLASFRLRWPFRFGAEWVAGCGGLDLDLIHYPAGVGPPRRDLPIVATIHDVSPFLRAECLPPHKAAYLRLAFTSVVRVARIILADSNWQAERIAVTLDIPADRIRVVPPCVSQHFLPQVDSGQRGANEGRLFFLAVGTLEPRKNIPRLLDAWRMLQTPHDLLLVGRWGWMYESLRTRLDMLGQHHVEPDGTERWEFIDGRRVIRREQLTAEELAACYRSAEALVYPSLFEGFGLPVLEAMVCGCPVVTSWRSPMEEIAGEAGWYADPEDEDSILMALREVLSSQDRRHERVLIGMDRAKAFSLERFAEGLLSAYLESTGGP